MGDMYNQGIGTLARKLQDGGETEVAPRSTGFFSKIGTFFPFTPEYLMQAAGGGERVSPTLKAAEASTDFQKQFFLGGPLAAAKNITKTVGLEKLSENIPQIERGDTFTDDLARGAGQFLLPFAGATKLVGGFAAGAKGVLQAEALGLAVSQLVFDPSDEKVSDLIDASISSDTSNPLLSAIKSTASALKVNSEDSELKQRLKLLGEDLLLSGAAGTAIVSPFLGKIAIQEGSRAILAGVEKGSKNLSEFFTSSKKQEGPVIFEEEISRPKLQKIKATEPLARAKESYDRINTTPLEELRTQLGTRFGIVDTKNISDTDVLSLHKELVRKDTGWYKIAGEDKWKREIDTSDLRINENAAEKMTQRVFPPGYKLQVIGFGDPKGIYTVQRNLEEKLSKNLKPVTKGFTPIKPEERELITSQFEDLINPDIAYRKRLLGATSPKDFKGSQADRFTKAAKGFLSLREEGRRFKNKAPVFALVNRNNQIVPDTIEASGFTGYFAKLSPEDTFNKSTFKFVDEKHPLTRQAFQDYEKLKQKTRSVLAKDFINQDSEFAKLYPELMDYKVSFEPNLNAKGALARHSKAKREVSLSVNPLIFPETAKNLLIHELTGHGVQAFSGLIRGGDLTTVDTVNSLISELERKAMKATSSAEKTEAFTKAETFKEYTKKYKDVDRQLSLKRSYRMTIDDQLPSPQRTASLKQIDEEIDALKKEKKVQAELFYNNLLGEVEARLLQTRASLNKNQRKDLSPLLDVQGFILRSLKDQGYTMDRLGNITGQTMKEGKLPWNVNVAQSLVKKIRDAQFSGVMETKAAFRPEFSDEIFKGEIPYEVATGSIEAEKVLKAGNIPFLQKDFRYDPSEPYFTRDVPLGEEIIYTDPRFALTEGAFIGERKLRDIPDETKIDGKEVRTIKKDFDKARIEFDRIQDLTASGISKELKNLGFKSQASMSPALQRKVLEELKVRRPYGWYRGSDGMKRREISDKTTSLDKTEAKRLSENPTKLSDYAYEVPVENILKGTPLFDAYPDMKGTLVSYKPELEGAYGVYMKGDIDLPNRIAISIDPKKYPHTVKSILLHEVAHQTQYFMRFAGGGNLRFANKVNDRLDNIYQKINMLETRLNLNKGLDLNDSNRLAQLRSETGPLEILLKDWKKLSSDLKKVDPETNPSQYKNLKEALDYEEEKMYRSVSGEQEARSIQRRDGLTPEERTILSPDIDLGQVIVKELEDQGYTVRLPSFKPDLKESLEVTITAPDGSNVFPSPVINLTKQLEDILKAERTALYRKSPFDKEQGRVRDELLKLQRIKNKTDKQEAKVKELRDVLGVGSTMNRADLRTRAEGRMDFGLKEDASGLKTDMYGPDFPFGESIIPSKFMEEPFQAMGKAPRKENVVSFYHGFDSEIDPDEIEFRKSIFGKKPRGGKGVSITSDPKIARGYGSTVIEVPLDLNRYKIFDYNNSDHKKIITDAIKNDPDFVKKFTKDSISRLKPRNVVDFLEVNSKVRDPEKRAKLTKKQLFEELDFSRPDLTENSHIVDILQEKGFEGVKQFEKGKEQYKLYNLEREDLFLIKNQEQRAKDNVALYKRREEIGKQSNLQKNAEAIQKAKDENALGPLATLLKKRNEIIKKSYPPTVFTADNFPMLPLYQRAQNALDKSKKEKIIDTGVDQLNENKSTLSLKSGQKVDARLDIPSYERQGTWVPAIHPQKRDPFSVGYPRTTQLKNVDFVQEGKSKRKALEVASGEKTKSPFATMTGNWVNHNSTELYKKAEKFLNDPSWTQIGYNPKRASYFYNTETLRPVKSADEVIQIGQLVLAKNVKYDKNLAKDFNRGGIVLRGTRPMVFATGIPTALRKGM